MTQPGRGATAPAPFDVFAAPLHGTQLLEASAGTGKTWTLTALHLRLLLETGLPISAILVVTFTEAAVAELRTRVRERLLHARDVLDSSHADHTDPAVARIVAQAREHTGLDDDKLRLRVTRALAEFDDAPISTIHAFCQRVLHESAFAARLPLEVETQTDDNELRLAAVRDFWRRDIAIPDLSPRTATQLARINASPEQWEPLLRDALAFPLAQRLWSDGDEGDEGEEGDEGRGRNSAREADRYAQLEAERQRCFEHASASWHRDNGRALEALMLASGGSSYSKPRITQAHRFWDRLFAAADPAAALVRDPSKLFTRGWLKEHAPKKLAPIPSPHLFDDLQAVFDAHDAIDAALRANVARLKQRMLERATNHLREAKAAQGVQTFQDMLTRTHERLHDDDALVAAVRQRLPAALVDEFQDTDPVQLGIFSKLYGGTDACMFLVGDPKQAIYSFRGADLESYLHARNGAGAHVWSLERNQRASPQLLHALNALFSRHPHVFGDSRLAFRASEAGDARRKPFVDEREPVASAALRIWSLPAGFDSTAAAKQAAARACAADIARTLEAARAGLVRCDDRALRGGDIAVLVRTNVEGRTMRRALADVGVASVDLSRASVFASLDAAEIDVLLHAMLDPGHTGKLRAAMASTLLGVDAERLAALHAAGTNPLAGDLVDDVIRDAEAALETTLARLLAWRGTWQRHGIAAMLSQALDDVGAAERLLGGRDGERRMTNLLHLMELLGRQERDTPLPQALLRWLGQQRRNAQGREDTQLRLESDRQLVQIVTVHRAKGLQYPIVVLPFLWHENAPRDKGGTRRWHDDEDRQVLDFRDWAQVDGDVKQRVNDAARAESLRLLYVALTRAEHRCILVVDQHMHGSSRASLRSMLNRIVAAQTPAFEDWHKIPAKPEARSRLIESAWRALVQATPHASFEPLPDDNNDGGTAADLRNDDAREVHHFDAPGPIGASWRLGSFSSFLRADAAAAPDGLLDTLDPTLGSGVDRDAGMADEGPGNDDAGDSNDGDDGNDAVVAVDHAHVITEDDILRFPRGPAAGDAMHALLERADFTRPDTWPAACAAALRLHPQRACAQAPAMLERMLSDLTTAEIAPGLALKDVSTTQRLDELEFDLPLPALRLERLERQLHALGLSVPPLGTGFDASHAFRGLPFRGLPFHGHCAASSTPSSSTAAATTWPTGSRTTWATRPRTTRNHRLHARSRRTATTFSTCCMPSRCCATCGAALAKRRPKPRGVARSCCSCAASDRVGPMRRAVPPVSSTAASSLPCSTSWRSVSGEGDKRWQRALLLSLLLSLRRADEGAVPRAQALPMNRRCRCSTTSSARRLHLRLPPRLPPRLHLHFHLHRSKRQPIPSKHRRPTWWRWPLRCTRACCDGRRISVAMTSRHALRPTQPPDSSLRSTKATCASASTLRPRAAR